MTLDALCAPFRETIVGMVRKIVMGRRGDLETRIVRLEERIADLDVRHNVLYAKTVGHFVMLQTVVRSLIASVGFLNVLAAQAGDKSAVEALAAIEKQLQHSLEGLRLAINMWQEDDAADKIAKPS